MIYHKMTWILLAIVVLISVSGYRITDTLEQNVPVTYCDGAYTLEAYYISEGLVRFYLNDESSDTLIRKQLYEFKEGSRIFVREVLEEEQEEGPDMVSFRFYPRFCIERNESPELVDAQIIVDMGNEVYDLPENTTRAVNVFGHVPDEPVWKRVYLWFVGLF